MPDMDGFEVCSKLKNKEDVDAPLAVDIVTGGWSKLAVDIYNANQSAQDYCDVSGGYIKLEPVN